MAYVKKVKPVKEPISSYAQELKLVYDIQLKSEDDKRTRCGRYPALLELGLRYNQIPDILPIIAKYRETNDLELEHVIVAHGYKQLG